MLSGADTQRWSGHSYPTYCNKKYLKFLHSKAAGTQKHLSRAPIILAKISLFFILETPWLVITDSPPSIMDDTNGTTDETDDYLGTTTDGYHDTSVRASEMSMDQDMSTDEHWLHYNTTDVNQSSQNLTTGYHQATDEITSSEISSLVFTLLVTRSILSPFILTCNGLTLIVVMKYIKKITPTHVVIAFHAFAGLLVGVIPLSHLAAYLAGISARSKYIFRIMVWGIRVARYLNVSAIMLIAVERFFLLTSWKMYRKYLTVKRQVVLCAVFGIYCFLLGTIFNLLVDFELKNGTFVPVYEEKAAVWALLVPSSVIPSCILMYCYLKIVVFLWKQRKTLAITQNCLNQSNFQKEKKTTVLIAIVVTVYLVGTLPVFLYVMIITENPKTMNAELLEFMRLIWCVTALVDFFLYAWKVPSFQKGYWKILCLGKSRVIQVAPWSSVQPFRSSLPLEPRRQFGVTLSSQGTAMKAVSTGEGSRGHLQEVN